MKNIKKFSINTIEKLDYYVYVYSDPDTGKAFYIGKGHGNRAFTHLKEESETKKVDKIHEIRRKGKEPKIEILVHGVDEETAKKVEAACIDLIGIENLTNKVRGYESIKYGKNEVNIIESKYSAKDELKMDDITDPVIMFKITNTYKNGMKPHEVYDITRGVWKIDLNKAKKYKYALAIYDSVVIEVYEMIEWFEKGSTFNCKAEELKKYEGKRYEFVGKIADDKIRNKYINKSIKALNNNVQTAFLYFPK